MHLKRIARFAAEGLPRNVAAAAMTLTCLHTAVPAFAAATHACPGGAPLATFRFAARSAAGGPALPVSALNVIAPGETLIYDPVGAAVKGNRRAAIGIILIADDAAGSPEVLPAKPAAGHAEWLVPMRASAIGVVFGPRGIDAKKLATILGKDPSTVDRLADYADQTSKVEALVQTLSKYEQSAPGAGNLQSVLNGFSSQYGVTLPALDRSRPAEEQAAALLRAITPAFAVDPASRPTLVQQSGGLAASVASLFFGPPAGLAIGGVALVGTLHASLFPPSDFRSAFTEKLAADGVALCTGGARPASGSRLEFVWMLRLPDAAPPAACRADVAHLPTGWRSTLAIRCDSVAALKALPRARDWRLVSTSREIPIDAAMSAGDTADSLTVDLKKGSIPAGTYRLAARWDWTPVAVAGPIDIRPFADLSTAAIVPSSEDRLIARGGPIAIELTGPDFEFLDRVAIAPASNANASTPVPFTLPNGKGGGEQSSVTVTIDTRPLKPGRYVLQLTQENGRTQTVAVLVHAPNPTLAQLPMKANVGEAKQTVDLHGTGLERVSALTSPGAIWLLKPLPAGAHDIVERQAEFELGADAHVGDHLALTMVASDLHEPIEIADAIEVIGPRPKVLGAKASIPGGPGVQLRDRELPAGVPVGFVLETENAGAHPRVRLSCDREDAGGIALAVGDRSSTGTLDAIGANSLFLSVDPGSVGPSGCTVAATVSNDATGASDAYVLGRVVHLPRIETFTISTETVGDALYAGTLVGEDLETIAKTGWNAASGFEVRGIPTPVPGSPGKQTLAIAVPWPPPSPHAPLYVWLRGEREGRATQAKY